MELCTNCVLPIAELAIAAALVISPFRSVVVLAIALFSLFAGYLIRIKWIGASVCPCTGSPSTDALAMLGLDFACISLLLLHPCIYVSLRSLIVVASYALLVPVASFMWIANSRMADAISASLSVRALTASYELGDEKLVEPAYAASAVISNRSRGPIAITEIHASCGCTQLSPTSVLLQPGESQELKLSVNLNKAFARVDQSIARLEVFAACYDQGKKEIANLQVLTTDVRRTFALKQDSVTFMCDNATTQECFVPVHWFSDAHQGSMQVYMQDQLLVSRQSDEGVFIQLPRLYQPFTSLRFELHHSSTRGLCRSEARVDLIRNGDPIRMV